MLPFSYFLFSLYFVVWEGRREPNKFFNHKEIELKSYFKNHGKLKYAKVAQRTGMGTEEQCGMSHFMRTRAV